jgi:hypothetical protein
VKIRAANSTHKKVMIRTLQGEALRGFLNPAHLGQADPLDVLTPDGEHLELALKTVKSICFVNEFTDDFEPMRKAFFSRPKLDGLWVRLRFRDGDTLEGIVPNNLLELLDRGVQITPPDMHGPTGRIFIPRSALAEMTVLGVVGVARRRPARAAAAAAGTAQPGLFGE